MKKERWRAFEQEGAACRLRLDAEGCARAYYEAALNDQYLRSQREHYSAYLFALHYLTGVTPEAMAEQHRVYGKLYPQPAPPPLGEVARKSQPAPPPPGEVPRKSQPAPPPLGEVAPKGSERVATAVIPAPVDRNTESVHALPSPPRIRSAPPPRGEALSVRVGFLASNFCESSSARFYEALLALPRPSFETFAYSLSGEADAFTAQVKKTVQHFQVLEATGLEQAEAAMMADNLDVLVDLGGHTDGGMTLMLLANHPAKRIIEAVGWFDTTGMTTVDELLTDAIMDPAGNEYLLTEHPLRLPHAWCFTPSAAMRAARDNAAGMFLDTKSSQPPASLSEGGGPRSGGGCPLHDKTNCTSYRFAGARTKAQTIHLAGFQNFLKLNVPILQTWKHILDRAPQSVLHLRDTMQSADRVMALEERCKNLGMPMDRVTIDMGSNDYLDTLAHMDLVLDTQPYPGGAMTATALYLGVPVLTIRGDSHSRSVGASILAAADLPELIAEDKEAYIEKAVGLASHPEKLAALKEKVWNCVPKSALCDRERYVGFWRKALQSPASLSQLR